MEMVTIRNKRTGKESQITAEQWAGIQRRPGILRAFTLIEIPIPPEVIKLQKRKAEEQKTTESI